MRTLVDSNLRSAAMLQVRKRRFGRVAEAGAADWCDPAAAPLIACALLYGALLLAAPTAGLVALGLWWNANTVAHNFIHRPFFRSRRANALFSAYLTVVLGFPQALWRERHLAHHAGLPRLVRGRADRAQFAVEALVTGGLWAGIGLAAPAFLTSVYLPGFVLGLALCLVQGRYEHYPHARSHYGPLYNLLFFNDGFHVEHHARPNTPWHALPAAGPLDPAPSRWPAILRWLEHHRLQAARSGGLELLERLTLHSRMLQRFVVDRHARAFERLVPRLPALGRITIVGGGLFPRTALVLRRLAPAAALTVLDQSPANVAIARSFLDPGVAFVQARWPTPSADQADLVVVPLAFEGDRSALYRNPPARALLIHDWIWRIRGDGCVVSWLLLKRLNLVRQ